RTIRDIGVGSTGMTRAPANLILYGTENPIDAIEIFGRYVKSIHGKDGLWPNRDEYLGKEVPVGQGMVNFPLLLRRLKNLGFEGPIIIEREISGERQIQDIKRAIEFFSKIL
ncbi:MAG: TIM barrel protein, partial [Candidatus Omnitrophica bacterium]|nr:TIM barrel protein [Candidatus Omnitrophota bacterium]